MIRWADRERVARAVQGYAEDLRRERPEVRDVYWYGSWVNGTPTPGSDADLCVVLSRDERPRRERLPDYLPSRFPTGVDLVVLTREELGRLRDISPEWYEAITTGRRFDLRDDAAAFGGP